MGGLKWSDIEAGRMVWAVGWWGAQMYVFLLPLSFAFVLSIPRHHLDR